MVNLDDETIETIRRLSDALKETPFDIKKIDVEEQGAGTSLTTMMIIEVRRRYEKA